MGLIIDTDVLILAEPSRSHTSFTRFQQFSDAFVNTPIPVQVIDYLHPA